MRILLPTGCPKRSIAPHKDTLTLEVARVGGNQSVWGVGRPVFKTSLAEWPQASSLCATIDFIYKVKTFTSQGCCLKPRLAPHYLQNKIQTLQGRIEALYNLTPFLCTFHYPESPQTFFVFLCSDASVCRAPSLRMIFQN